MACSAVLTMMATGMLHHLPDLLSPEVGKHYAELAQPAMVTPLAVINAGEACNDAFFGNLLHLLPAEDAAHFAQLGGPATIQPLQLLEWANPEPVQLAMPANHDALLTPAAPEIQIIMDQATIDTGHAIWTPPIRRRRRSKTRRQQTSDKRTCNRTHITNTCLLQFMHMFHI